MITNTNITIYHKIFDETSREYKWIRFNYDNVWFFGGKGSSINKGYENANDSNARIPYNDELDISNFKIGDIIVRGKLETDITTQEDLKGYEVYNITSINDNNFGNNPHIHIGGK